MTFCPTGSCESYCYKLECVDICPLYTFHFNSSCLARCPEDANFVTTMECDMDCYLMQKACYSQCPEPYRYVMKTPFFMWCLKQCPIYSTINNTRCELSCSSAKPYLYNNTCWKTCPSSHKFAYLHVSKFNEILMCTDSCSDRVRYRNQCISRCPSSTVLHNNSCLSNCPTTDPLLYSTKLRFRNDVPLDKSDFVCVSECGTHYSVFNSSCVNLCPETAPFSLNGSCKSECADDQPLHLEDHTECISSCPSNYFLFNNTDTCYGHCPQIALYTYNQTCHPKCPETLPFEVEHQANSFIFDGTSYRSNVYYKCVKECPIFNVQQKCVNACPTTAIYQFRKACVSNCSGDLPFHMTKWRRFHKAEYICVKSCPIYLVNHTSICTSFCPSDAKFLYNNVCVKHCPISKQFQEKYVCVQECRQLSFNDVCVTKCPGNAKYQSGSSCVRSCKGSLPYHYSNTTRVRKYYGFQEETNFYCLGLCPKSLYIFDYRCVDKCPKTTFYLENKCLYDCRYPFQYRLPSSQKCVNACPNNTFLHNSTCVPSCPSRNFQFQNACVTQCPSTHAWNYTRNGLPGNIQYICVDTCPNTTFALKHSEVCFDNCQPDFYTDKDQCVTTCPEARGFVINTTKECTNSCFDMYLHGNTCVAFCPEETLAFGNFCVTECPSSHSLKYISNSETPVKKVCVHECLNNTYRYNESCFDICPTGQVSFKRDCVKNCPSSHPIINVNTRKCIKTCHGNLVLTYPNKCDVKCPGRKHFIENGTCMMSCNNNSRLYYPTSNGYLCTNSCSGDYVQLQETNLCQQKCPLGRIIIDGVCMLHGKCKDHPYVEYTKKGNVCKHGCSAGKYLNGTNCIYSCPIDMFTLNNTCVEKCPSTSPYIWKFFKITMMRQCLANCPFFTVKNNTDCIALEECIGFLGEKDNAVHNGECVFECPSGAVKFKDGKCRRIFDFIAPIVICSLISIGLIISILKMVSCSKKTTKTVRANDVSICRECNFLSSHFKNRNEF